MTAVDCNSLLAIVISEMQATIEESHATITSAILPTLKGNETALKQLFQNLISNAIKFRKKNEPLHIDIAVEEKETEYLFTIKDNGIGIEEQYQEKIFVIFQRLHNASEYPGTGIGLATCNKIVALHKGKIGVQSKEGEGSAFYFTLSKKI
jgi:light-regulated signal transduction histidine kinase (bacteriophytochrome)